MKRAINALPFWIIKIIRFEFWPFWVFYLPVFFYYIYLSIKSKSFAFFTATNPGIYLGGFVGESKKSILQRIDSQYLPNSLYYKSNTNIETILKDIKNKQIDFPFIIKPDVGERGDDVEIISTEQELASYLPKHFHSFIIQEYIAYPLEFGILHYHLPDGTKSEITSIVLKEFLSIEGDGKSTTKELITRNMRANLRLAYLLNKHQSKLNNILPKGEKLVLEPIGNHCRGTKFINANHLINDKLLAVFDTISKTVDGFYFGRYDLKVNTIEDLYEGKNIKIMELNGVTSEPAHIYDPATTIFEAYSALFYQYKIMFNIAKQNHKLGVEFAPFALLYKQIKMHLIKHNRHHD